MTIDTTDQKLHRNGKRLPPTTIFSLLADTRRRTTIHALSHAVGAVDIDDLVERIAPPDADRDDLDRLALSLAHVHLPKLAETGVVSYDPVRMTVERQPVATQFHPYLQLAERVSSSTSDDEPRE